jgi:hypothetical protein
MYNPKSKQKQKEDRINNTVAEFGKLSHQNGLDSLIKSDEINITDSKNWVIYIWKNEKPFEWGDTKIAPKPIKLPIEYTATEIIEYLKVNKPEYFL